MRPYTPPQPTDPTPSPLDVAERWIVRATFAAVVLAFVAVALINQGG